MARAVLEHTYHTILVGENATNFAISLGFESQPLSSERSKKIYEVIRNFHFYVINLAFLSKSVFKCGLK